MSSGANWNSKTYQKYETINSISQRQVLPPTPTHPLHADTDTHIYVGTCVVFMNLGFIPGKSHRNLSIQRVEVGDSGHPQRLWVTGDSQGIVEISEPRSYLHKLLHFFSAEEIKR